MRSCSDGDHISRTFVVVYGLRGRGVGFAGCEMTSWNDGGGGG